MPESSVLSCAKIFFLFFVAVQGRSLLTFNIYSNYNICLCILTKSSGILNKNSLAVKIVRGQSEAVISEQKL